MTQKELIKKIEEASKEIHKRRLSGNANYIICSPKIAEAIDNLDIKKSRKKKLIEINKKASE